MKSLKNHFLWALGGLGGLGVLSIMPKENGGKWGEIGGNGE